MKQKLLIIAIALWSIASFSSCGRCGGCDEIETTVGASLVKGGTINLVSKESFKLIILPDSKTTKGTRRCYKKDLVTCRDGGIVVEKMKLICDRDLLLRTGNIIAGSNLLAMTAIKDTSYKSYFNGDIALLLKPEKSFPAGRYFFTLEGTTAEGTPLSDTTSFLFTR